MLPGGSTYDDMVEKIDSEKIGRACNPFCHLPVRSARRRISRGMIMNQNKAIRLMENHRVKDISWVRNCFIQASFGENQ